MIKTLLKFTLAGAAVGGLAGWFLFGGTSYNATTGNYGWGVLMAPTFAIIGAIAGALNFVVLSSLRGLRNLSVRPETGTGLTGEHSVNEAEWQNAANWWGGLFYHSRNDSRTFVPKKMSRAGYTINLRQPLGMALLIGLIVLVLVILALTMI